MLKDRFQILLDLANKTQTEIAEDLNIHSSYVSKILSGRQKSIGKKLAQSIAEKYGCDYDWIMSGVGNPPEKPAVVHTAQAGQKEGEVKDVVEIKVLTLAGLGDLYDLQNHKPIEVTELAKDLVINVGRETRAAIRCKGDSMSPTILTEALVGIDFNDREPVDNGIFLLRFRDLGLTIKRLRLKTDGFLIVADNPTIEDEFVHRDRIEEGLILGRVRWIHNKV